MSVFCVEVEHGLTVEAAVKGLERACEYYQAKYIRYVIFWRKLSPTEFEVGVRVNETDGAIRAEALPSKVVLSAEIPKDAISKNLIVFLVKNEAKKWLKSKA